MSIEDWLQRIAHLLNEPLLKIGDSKLTLGKVAAVILFLFAAYLAVMVLDRLLKRLTRPGRAVTLSESGVYALSRIIRYAVWIFVAFSGLNYLGISLSNFAIVGGAIGVGIGFGLQNIFSNFISGIVLLVEQTLKVGDFVDLQSGVVGKVAEIGIRYTRVTTNDSVDVIVPNSEFIDGRVTNWTFNHRSRRIHVPFGVAYGSDKELVREAGLAAAAAVGQGAEPPAQPPDVWLVGFGDSSLNFELVLWVDSEKAVAPARTQALYLWQIETELAKRKLEIPFPQRDLHIRSGVLKIDRGDAPAG